MAMNVVHRWCCSSQMWARKTESQLLPWALQGVELGEDALEIGPGYGANLRVLTRRTPQLTAVEIDETMASRLQRLYGDQATVIQGDGTKLGFDNNRFSSVVCFTMLHHVPTPDLQDALFTQAHRVLAPGGVFAGSDGVHSTFFRLLHIGDTYNPVPTTSLPDRLRAAGFTDIEHHLDGGNQRWRAVKAA